MNEKDQKLIEEATKVNYVFWSDIEALIEKAESEECKLELKAIMRRKELREQAFAGCL